MLFGNTTWSVYHNRHDILRTCDFINNQQNFPLIETKAFNPFILLRPMYYIYCCIQLRPIHLIVVLYLDQCLLLWFSIQTHCRHTCQLKSTARGSTSRRSAARTKWSSSTRPSTDVWRSGDVSVTSTAPSGVSRRSWTFSALCVRDDNSVASTRPSCTEPSRALASSSRILRPAITALQVR